MPPIGKGRKKTVHLSPIVRERAAAALADLQPPVAGRPGYGRVRLRSGDAARARNHVDDSGRFIADNECR
jgi:hypothetical protein